MLLMCSYIFALYCSVRTDLMAAIALHVLHTFKFFFLIFTVLAKKSTASTELIATLNE